jgi:hypothetical protein
VGHLLLQYEGSGGHSEIFNIKWSTFNSQSKFCNPTRHPFGMALIFSF